VMTVTIDAGSLDRDFGEALVSPRR
jgi:hypothetical protein